MADTLSWTDDLAAALDPPRSTINPFRWPPGDGDLAGQPRNYAYGHFPLYLLALVAHAAQAAGSWFGRTTLAFPPAFQPLYTVGRHLAEYKYLPLVGRASLGPRRLGDAAAGIRAGRRISEPANGRMTKDEKTKDTSHNTYPGTLSTLHASRFTLHATGFLAAAIYAFAVLPIQLSHFVAVDAILTFCVTASVALAARWTRRGGWVTWLFAGVLAGLAVGSKFSAVLLALPLAVAALYRLPTASLGRKTLIIGGRLAAAGAVAMVVFVLTNPFAVIEFPAYVRQIMAQNAMVSGLMDAPYTRQYIGTLPYLYFVQQLSQWGLGWPLGVVAWGGFVWAVIGAARRRASPTLVVMLAWALPYFAFTGAFHAKFPRYMAPLLPFLVVFGRARRWPAIAGWLVAGTGGDNWSGARSPSVSRYSPSAGRWRSPACIARSTPGIAASRWIYAQRPGRQQAAHRALGRLAAADAGRASRQAVESQLPADRAPDVGSGYARQVGHAGERVEQGGLHCAGEQPAVCADRAPRWALSDGQPVLPDAVRRRSRLPAGGGVHGLPATRRADHPRRQRR